MSVSQDFLGAHAAGGGDPLPTSASTRSASARCTTDTIGVGDDDAAISPDGSRAYLNTRESRPSYAAYSAVSATLEVDAVIEALVLAAAEVLVDPSLTLEQLLCCLVPLLPPVSGLPCPDGFCAAVKETLNAAG
jgi:hypothetical protein